MNEEDEKLDPEQELKKARDQYDAENQQIYDEVTKGNEELRRRQEQKSNEDIIDEVMGPDEDDDDGISQYALNRQQLNESRIFEKGRFQEQLDSLPQLTIQDLSELAIDAKMAMEAAKKVPGGPYIKTGAALGSVALRRLLPQPNYGKLIDNVFESSFFKNREPITVYALGK